MKFTKGVHNLHEFYFSGHIIRNSRHWLIVVPDFTGAPIKVYRNAVSVKYIDTIEGMDCCRFKINARNLRRLGF